jgi:hypothetical protein
MKDLSPMEKLSRELWLMLLFTGIMLIIFTCLIGSGIIKPNDHIELSEQDMCSGYKDMEMKGIPAKCLKYFNN